MTAMPRWQNNSKTDRLWDKRNNRHIEPRQIVNNEPDPSLIRMGLMSELVDGYKPVINNSPEPIMVGGVARVEPSLGDVSGVSEVAFLSQKPQVLNQESNDEPDQLEKRQEEQHSDSDEVPDPPSHKQRKKHR